MNDQATYFVSTFSRVNTVPQSVLMDNQGNKLMDLETTDLSKLMETGYQFPEPYTVKADDGITDLYGVLYKPFDFDQLNLIRYSFMSIPAHKPRRLIKPFPPVWTVWIGWPS